MATESASTDQPRPPPAAKSRGPRIAKRLGLGLGAVLITMLAYLLLWPSPIDSVAYQPPPKPVPAWPGEACRVSSCMTAAGVLGLVGPPVPEAPPGRTTLALFKAT